MGCLRRRCEEDFLTLPGRSFNQLAEIVGFHGVGLLSDGRWSNSRSEFDSHTVGHSGWRKTLKAPSARCCRFQFSPQHSVTLFNYSITPYIHYPRHKCSVNSHFCSTTRCLLLCLTSLAPKPFSPSLPISAVCFPLTTFTLPSRPISVTL
ncbi:unnamed protein product [Taenia asiatica]|uniref:Uncharacterized protein n=1 Tax=Taenia asiatica TaxID=60517 RepID=A0A0R3VXH4_TAEAS|nr:unnamed protein product [Taenia asiatica]